MLNKTLLSLMRGAALGRNDMATAMGAIMDGEVPQAQIAAFLVALRIKGETVDEITGAVEAMRARMTRIHTTRTPLVDTCGTGGDGGRTFNISTATAFVLAAGGAVVAKHGNRAVSSRSGSADVLTQLGIDIAAPKERVEELLERFGIGFLFAPSFHPAMRHAAPVRRDLGLRTIFNVLGPLTNPAGARRQVVGVFDRALVRPLAQVLGALGAEHAWVVHGADGLDELTLCAETFVAEWDGGTVRELTVEPEELGLPRARPEELAGGTPSENAEILRQVLGGTRQDNCANVVALNAAAGFLVAGLVADLAQGLARARDVLASGGGLRLVERLATTTPASVGATGR
ncbi:MAG: anthranilate phosphoribosyltransferase [Myxococcota bacterium]